MTDNTTSNNVVSYKQDGIHDHAHDHSHVKEKKKRRWLTKTQSLIFMLFLTSTFFLVELIVGNITKSNALVADAFHMLSDVISLIIGLVAIRISKRTASARNTFGWVRAEILGSLINSVFLLALCFSIIIEAINRFIDPEPLEHVSLMLIVGGVGLFINLLGLLIFGMHGHEHGHSHGGHGHSHGSHGHSHSSADTNHHHEDDSSSDEEKEKPKGEINYASDVIVAVINEPKSGDINKIETNKQVKSKVKKRRSTKNMNIHGVFLHVLSDALGSIAVIISGLIVKYAPPQDDAHVRWKMYIDPALSLIITILITISTVPLLKQASLILLQTVPGHFNLSELAARVKSIEGVLDVHHFHVWSLNAERLVASAHLRVSRQDLSKENETIHEVKKLLHSNDIHATTLQLEYDGSKCEINYNFCESSECRKKQCCSGDQTDLLKSKNKNKNKH